jgi:hypothetical protein
MPPLFAAIVGAFVRAGLIWLATRLVDWGVFQQGDVEGYVVGLTVAIVALAWSVWAKYKDRIKFKTALEAPAGASEAKVLAKIADGLGAKIGSAS